MGLCSLLKICTMDSKYLGTVVLNQRAYWSSTVSASVNLGNSLFFFAKYLLTQTGHCSLLVFFSTSSMIRFTISLSALICGSSGSFLDKFALSHTFTSPYLFMQKWSSVIWKQPAIPQSIENPLNAHLSTQMLSGQGMSVRSPSRRGMCGMQTSALWSLPQNLFTLLLLQCNVSTMYSSLNRRRQLSQQAYCYLKEVNCTSYRSICYLLMQCQRQVNEPQEGRQPFVLLGTCDHYNGSKGSGQQTSDLF